MSAIAAASNALYQAAAVDQAVEAKLVVAIVAVVAVKTGPGAALPSIERSTLSINKFPGNPCTPLKR